MNKSAAFILVLVLTTSLPLTVRAANPSADNWTRIAPLDVATALSGASVVNGKIYAFGSSTTGGTSMNGTTYPQEYNPATNNWSPERVMPSVRVDFAVAAYQNKIYVIGGIDPYVLDHIFNIVEVYDPATNAWTSKAPMPEIGHSIRANVVNGKIYVIGGLRLRCGVPQPTHVYDPSTDSWTTAAPIPIPVYAYASAVVDNKIYVMSGMPNSNGIQQPVNATQIYDPATDNWTFGAPIPSPVAYAAAGATTGAMAPKRIYVLGGADGSAINQVYDPETDSWTLGAGMLKGRYSHAVAVINDVVYAMGGCWFVPNPFSGVSYGRDSPFLADAEQYIPLGYGGAPMPSPPPASSPSPSPTVTPPNTQPEPFPTTLVAALSVATVAVVGVGLLVYLRKRAHREAVIVRG